MTRRALGVRFVLFLAVGTIIGCAGKPAATDTGCINVDDCGEGQLCVDTVCIDVCEVERDCAVGFTCIDDLCRSLVACAPVEGCGPGMTCRDDYCRFACAVDGDCTGRAEECNRGACLPEAPPEADCDGLDDNDNGQIDEDFDFDGDGYTLCGSWDGNGFASPDAFYVDCDDAASDVFPGAAEVCGNSIDEDCTGIADDGACMLDLQIGQMAIVPGAGTAGGNIHQAAVRISGTEVTTAQSSNLNLVGRLRASH